MRHPTRIRLFDTLAAFALLAFTGCSVGPDYGRPEAPESASFKESSEKPGESAPALASDWWKLFNDPDLDRLEADALNANQDIRAAFARVNKARALGDGADAAFWPSIDGTAGAQRSRNSGTSSNTVNAGGDTRTSYSARLGLTYEADVWGRVRRLSESADASAKTSATDFAVVLQTVQGEVAQNYFNLRGFDTQVEIIAKNLALFARQVALTDKQVKVGLAPRTDLLQAQTLLESTRTQLIEARRQRANVEHALAILTGKPPAALGLDPKPLTTAVPVIPAGLPVEMLARRPDVAAAEYRLIAANADVGVAKANYYPKFTLTGSAGVQTIDTSKLSDWESRVWSLAPSISIPLFQGGELDADLAAKKASYDETLANFRTAVLTAFRDVEDSLNDLKSRAEAAASQDRTLASARENARLAELAYRNGLTNYLLVIDANRTLLANELSAAQLQNQRLASSVALIKALGGGWNKDAEVAEPPAGDGEAKP
jgi:outer membrane protein, multidrug efflux system